MIARTILNAEVIKHIDKCFTMKGMKTSVKKGGYFKRRIGPGAEQDNAGEQDKGAVSYTHLTLPTILLV